MLKGIHVVVFPNLLTSSSLIVCYWLTKFNCTFPSMVGDPYACAVNVRLGQVDLTATDH